MQLNLIKTIFNTKYVPNLFRSKRLYGIYEPDYLKDLKPKDPIYEMVNVQIQGHEFPVLENYQKFLMKTAMNMNIDVESSWPMPVQVSKIVRYKPYSTICDYECTLRTYERCIKICDLTTQLYSLFLRIIEASQPEGVTVNVMKYEPIHNANRYIPDYELNDLKNQLESMISGTAKKK